MLFQRCQSLPTEYSLRMHVRQQGFCCLVLTLLTAQFASAIAQSPASSASASKSSDHSAIPSVSANADVLKMLKAGLPQSVILAKIHMETDTFDTSADALIALKKAGASEAVLDAILNHVKPADRQAAPESQTHVMTGGTLVPSNQADLSPSMPPAKMAPQNVTGQVHAAADSNTPEAVVTSFAASASRPGQIASAAPAVISSTMAHVYFYRQRQFIGSGLSPSIYCDNVQLAKLRTARYFLVDIPTGMHDCYTDGKTKPENEYIKTGPKTDIDLKAGNNYYFMIKFDAGFRLPLTSMQPEQAESDIKQLQPLEGKYIFHNALPSGVWPTR